MTQFSEVRRAGSSHPRLGRCPTTRAEEGRRRTLHAIHAPLITTSAAPTSTVGGVLAGPIVDAYTRLKYISTCAAAQMAPAHFGRSQSARPLPRGARCPLGGARCPAGRLARTRYWRIWGQLLKLLEVSQDRLTLLGRREGRDPLQRQEQRVAQYRDDHGHQPHSSDAASCEVGAQGEDGEDQAEYAVQ